MASHGSISQFPKSISISLGSAWTGRSKYTANRSASAVHRIHGLLSIRDVIREDLNMAEGCTDALSSGVLQEIQLSDQELAVRHSYAVVDRLVREYLAGRVA